MKKWIRKLLPVFDVLMIPFVYASAWLLKNIRRQGVQELPRCKKVFINMGVFPVRDHYYEPQFNFENKKQRFSDDRFLPGIEWNIQAQLDTLKTFSHTSELVDIPENKAADLEFYLNNGSFGYGDAEYWYQLIRSTKPNCIIEIGSGNSTLMAIRAIRQNRAEHAAYSCKHVCIEPYEMPWLEQTSVSVIREKVEDLDVAFFSELEANDILFIDSSHIIRPQGDVLFEYLSLLPTLKKGVIVHIHDIFSPKNYKKKWLEDQVRLWNEQYLLEAFLTHNTSWEIIGALNYLHHNYYDNLHAVAPNLTPDKEPGSFYIQKVT